MSVNIKVTGGLNIEWGQIDPKVTGGLNTHTHTKSTKSHAHAGRLIDNGSDHSAVSEGTGKRTEKSTQNQL